MPRKKQETVVEAPIAMMETVTLELVVEEEVRPRKHMVFIKQHMPIPELNTIGYKKVGTITYWESTDDLTYDYEVGFQIHMDNLVERDIDVKGGESVQRKETRAWFENLPNSLLHNGFFASEVSSFYENE